MSLDDDFSAFLEEVDHLTAPDAEEQTKIDHDVKNNNNNNNVNQPNNNMKKRKLNVNDDVDNNNKNNEIKGFQIQDSQKIHSQQQQQQPSFKKAKLHNHYTNKPPPLLYPHPRMASGRGRGGNVNIPAWMANTQAQEQQNLIGRPPLLNANLGSYASSSTSILTPPTISSVLPQGNVQAVFGPTIPSHHQLPNDKKVNATNFSTTSTTTGVIATNNGDNGGGGVTTTIPEVKKWPENDFRLFVGDLDVQVKAEHLNDAFSKYKSFAMSRVIINHKTNMSKGYGFVSFLDPYDCYNAMKEMNRKVIMGRPITLKVDQKKTKYNPKNIRAKEKRRKKFFKRFK